MLIYVPSENANKRVLSWSKIGTNMLTKVWPFSAMASFSQYESRLMRGLPAVKNECSGREQEIYKLLPYTTSLHQRFLRLDVSQNIMT